jgi:hypothetical protein
MNGVQRGIAYAQLIVGGIAIFVLLVILYAILTS